jgi:hypothetical protein
MPDLPVVPAWLNKGDNAWQLVAATFVGLQSMPGLVVLYGPTAFQKKKSPYDHQKKLNRLGPAEQALG